MEMVDEDKEEDEGGMIPLPTVGNAIAKAVNSGPGKTLLTPAAKAFGDYLGWRAKEITDRWKKQREKNLETHADKVREREGTPVLREPTEKQVILVSEWIERAQEVDPDDPEIAALWQSLLGAIYRKETNAKEWLEVIKQLNESDARLLLCIPQDFEPRNSREHGQATKLESLGLLEGFHLSRVVRWVIPNLLVLVIAIVVIVVFSSMPEQLVERYFGGTWLLAKPIVIGITILFSALNVIGLARNYLRHINQYSITDLGRDIRRSARRYLEKKPRVAENEMKEAAAETKPESEPAPEEKKPKRGRQKAAPDTKVG
jgi:hypothetical protein